MDANDLNDSGLGIVLAKLAPSKKLSVHEVLIQCGFDVSEWSVTSKGRRIENPAVNGRAYEWSFKDSTTDQSVFMLWHAEMAVRDGAIRYRRSWGGLVAELERTRRITARRADAFLKHVSELKLGTIVRAGIVEGAQASSTDDEASSVSRRWLDPEPWHLSFWDPMTSTFEFTRGLPQAELHTANGDADARASGESPRDPAPPPGPEIIADDLNDIIRSGRSETEKERLVTARLGQGRFRQDVLARWDNACAVTGTVTLAALRASHCKPWRDSDDAERLDPANGLPLAATLDALFDVGLISFEDDGKIMVSGKIDDPSLTRLIEHCLSRTPSDDERAYLAHHRASIYQG